MPILTLDKLEKRYGHFVAASDVSLTVNDGEFVSLLGPSGCGKTTVLRMIAGLLEPTSGSIHIDDKDITRLPSNKRNIGLVFQSYALFPHMTVLDNIAFGLRRQGIKGHELEQRVKTALQRVRLHEHGSRYPRQLSGGQQQRVAVARSIAPEPQVLLFDEPLSNLDAALRDEMQFELKRLQSELGITTLFVTHDQEEAMSMSDRVCVLAHGVVQQFASPEAVYHRPANAFVAGFIGKSNQLAATVKDITSTHTTVSLASGHTLKAVNPAHKLLPGQSVNVIVRQEDFSFHPQAHDTALTATVAMRSFVGSRVQYALTLGPGCEFIASTSPNSNYGSLSPSSTVHVSIAPERVYLASASEAAA